MKLVKLDSGGYIKLDVVEFTRENNHEFFIGDNRIYITPANYDRIVEAMGGEDKARATKTIIKAVIKKRALR